MMGPENCHDTSSRLRGAPHHDAFVPLGGSDKRCSETDPLTSPVLLYPLPSRAYVLLSRVPFFALHFSVLRAVLDEERLSRIRESMIPENQVCVCFCRPASPCLAALDVRGKIPKGRFTLHAPPRRRFQHPNERKRGSEIQAR